MKKERLSLFWRCFITYLLSVLFFICIQAYSNAKTSKLVQQLYTGQVQEALELNAESLSDGFAKFKYFPQVMGLSKEYKALIQKDSIGTTEDSNLISQTMINVNIQRDFFSLANDIVIFMPRSGLSVTPHSFYMNLEDFFDTYDFGQSSIEDSYSNNRYEPERLILLPAGNIQIRSKNVQPGQYMSCILRSNMDGCIYMFLISKEKLLKTFQIETLPENSVFSLCNKSDGTVLFTNGVKMKENEEYFSLRTEIPNVQAVAVIHIPMSFLSGITRKSIRSYFYLMAVSLLVGLLLSYLFSRFSTQPVRELAEAVKNPEEKKTKNELVTIYNYLNKSEEQRRQMQGQLLSNLLIRAFSGLPVTEEELKALPDREVFEQPARAAIVRYRQATSNQEMHSLLLYQIRNRFPECFHVESINLQEIGLFFPATAENDGLLKDYMDELNRDFTEGQQVVCGVSAAFTGGKNLNVAVQQALFSLPGTNEYYSEFIPAKTVVLKYPDKIPDFMDFQQALFNWNLDESNRLIDIYAQAAVKLSRDSAQELFYTLLALLRNAAQAVNLSSEFFDECRFARSISGEANIRALSVCIEYLFKQKASVQEDRRKMQSKEIIQFVVDHFDDPVLNATTVSDRFGKSERTINTVFNAETGMSLSNYLTGIRMQKAGEMLRETELEAADVAEKCGLTVSTFYRCFKRYYRMTPVEYKSQFRN